MIIYIASYPRSGNSWIRRLIREQFGRLESTVYSRKHPSGMADEDWNLRIVNRAPSTSELNKVWNEWTALYEAKHPPGGTHRFLMPDCKEILTEEFRAHLAREKEHFFLKTHELPFPRYFEGEYVIQPVRNVGATLWSYYNFIKARTKNTRTEDTHRTLTQVIIQSVRSARTRLRLFIRRGIRTKNTRTGNAQPTLAQVIKGEVEFGSWSDYYMQWSAAASELGDRYLQVYYEWLSDHVVECCHQIEQFTGLKYLEREFSTFEQLHTQNPLMYREGLKGGWEKYYSKEQLHLLWEIHGEMMQRLGYPEPEYELGLDKVIY